ncbi:hypothetical protein EG830_01055 [bacterium]|nr:hypothetical protein [bacterium]
MARDFTLTSFRNLLATFLVEGYSFTTVTGYKNIRGTKTIVLRHDVDSSPLNSVFTALAEHASGIRGTYYFRYGRRGFDREIIRQITDLGHEAGYHYEDLSLEWRRAKRGTGEEEIAATAFENFRSNLQKLRSITSTETVCMHGSPLSSIDSRLMWKYFDYRELGVVAEPYMDLSFEDMLYLTDTGRRWDGSSISVRDKAGSLGNKSGEGYKGWKVEPMPGSLMHMTARSAEMQSRVRFRSTDEIVNACNAGRLPEKIMMTVHPQRWDDRPIPWLKELVAQKAKNTVKYFIVRFQ